MNYQNDDYRLWPNILTLNERIFALNVKIETCEVETERIALKLVRDSLVSQRFDQLQINKELFYSFNKVS